MKRLLKKERNNSAKNNEFVFAAVALNHGHIYGMCEGLIDAGATLKWVFDSNSEKIEEFVEKFPEVKIAHSLQEILNDKEVQLVAAADIPAKRSDLGNKVMKAGKDYFTDKTPFTTLSQLEETRKIVHETKQKYMVYFSERLHVESAVFTGELIKNGEIGDVVQVTGFGPHRLNKSTRPNWFFEKNQYGGILCDIGSHQIEQFLHYSNNKDAKVLHSKVGNYNNHDYPEFEDYGDATLIGENGATFYFKVDWLTPEGLSNWGDGRLFITGTEGTIEVRKFIDLTRSSSGDHLFLVNKHGEKYFHLQNKIGFPFFEEMILDCLNRTENAMTQNHIFKASELCLIAQEEAIQINKIE